MTQTVAAAAGTDAERRAGRVLAVRCLLRDQHGHVRPVEEALGGRARFAYDADWDPEAIRRERPDLVLCVNDFPYEISRCLDAAREEGIPTLALQDGILEWRCQYENPLFGAGGGAPQHQPVLADKLACIGAASARHIASWGNGARVEVTGMPRLDPLVARSFASPRRPGRRVLVMTAKKPWYDEGQRTVIERSLVDLKAALASRPECEVVWRVTRGLAEQLGVANRLTALESAELSAVLDEVDAVITTPSTAILEAMVAGRPVAALDYHNVPRFVPTAWTISAASEIPSVLAEILDPPASKTMFQRECLRDNLRTDGSAAPRVAALIEAMAEVAARSRQAGAPLRLPANMARFREPFMEVQAEVEGEGETPNLAELYPGHAAFATADSRVLQVRLARLEHEYAKLKRGTVAGRVARRLSGMFRGMFRR